MTESRQEKIDEFVVELNRFATTAEIALNRIENHPEESTQSFGVFTEQMIAIRGTADQLGFPNVSKIAGLGEEIAVKAGHATSPNHIKKCMNSLWDSLTTVKYMLEHPSEGPSEEQGILLHRLESVLKFLGGARPTISVDEIEALLNPKK